MILLCAATAAESPRTLGVVGTGRVAPGASRVAVLDTRLGHPAQV
jgi:hypothetical protein